MVLGRLGGWLRSNRPALALFAVSLVLRPSIVAVGPLAGLIANDLHTPDSFVALLATFPILCMGLFAGLGPLAARHLGPRMAMAAAAAIVVVCALLRAAAPSPPAIIALTILVGVGIGAAGALPAIVAKQDAGGVRAARLSGAAAAGVVAGATLAGAAAVPLAGLPGSWRTSLAVLGGLGLLSLGAWLLLYPQEERPATQKWAPISLPWRSRVAWLLAFVFGLQAIVYWGATTWLPSTYEAWGWSATDAGDLVALLNVVALAGNLLVATSSDRFGSRPWQVIAAAAGIFVSVSGFLAAPDGAIPWTVLLGLSQGAIFPLLLALTVDVAADAMSAGAVSAFMLTVGYIIAGLGPLLLGAARDISGGFNDTFPLLVSTGVVLVIMSVALLIDRRAVSSPVRLAERLPPQA